MVQKEGLKKRREQSMTEYNPSHLQKWAFGHAVVVFITAITLIFAENIWLLTLIAFFSFSLLLYSDRLSLSKIKPWGGYANHITLFRLGLVMAIPLIAIRHNGLAVLITGSAVILLDGADGYVARKTNNISKTGALLDMETDALFVLILSFIHWQSGTLPFWILGVGLMKYLYTIIIYLAGLLSFDRTRTRLGPVAAVFLFVAELFPYFTPGYIYVPVITAASIFVFISFVYSGYLAINNKNKVLQQ